MFAGCTWWGDDARFSTYLAPNSSQADLIYSTDVCAIRPATIRLAGNQRGHA